MKRALISLTSDFGYKDPFVGTMKGVILRINPLATVVDVSHGITPQDVLAGALALGSAVPFFPPHSIHIAVVDPGVGTTRRPILIQTADAFFIGPDNGVLSLAVADAKILNVVHLSNPDYYLEPTSTTFHGRDIFAPAGAYLSTGVPCEELGTAVNDFERISWPSVLKEGKSLSGSVVYVDGFGNLITNIHETDLQSWPRSQLEIGLGSKKIRGLTTSYSAAGAGALLALINSWGLLEIACCNGNARADTGADIGSNVTVTLETSSA